MSKITRNQLGITDIHTHAGGLDTYNFFKLRSPMSQSVKDLILKAKMNDIDHLVTFPMPMPFYYDPIQITLHQKWSHTGYEEFPYALSNKALLYEARIFGDGIVLPFMIIDPKEKISEQIMFLEENISYIYGLKLHTRAININPLELSDSPFIDFLERHNLPILIHSRSQPAFTHAKHIVQLSEYHPNIRICIAHLADLDNEIINSINYCKNLYIDCTPFLSICHFALTKNYEFVSNNLFQSDYNNPSQCLININNVIPGKLLWGTDEPWTSISDHDGSLLTKFSYHDEVNTLKRIAKMGFPSIMKAISSENTANFLFG